MKTAAMAPSRTITMEITHARTGRSMKKRASMTAPDSTESRIRKTRTQGDRRHRWGGSFRARPWSLSLARHGDELRRDGGARAGVLRADDDHAVAASQAVGELRQPAL